MASFLYFLDTVFSQLVSIGETVNDGYVISIDGYIVGVDGYVMDLDTYVIVPASSVVQMDNYLVGSVGYIVVPDGKMIGSDGYFCDIPPVITEVIPTKKMFTY